MYITCNKTLWSNFVGDWYHTIPSFRIVASCSFSLVGYYGYQCGSKKNNLPLAMSESMRLAHWIETYPAPEIAHSLCLQFIDIDMKQKSQLFTSAMFCTSSYVLYLTSKSVSLLTEFALRCSDHISNPIYEPFESTITGISFHIIASMLPQSPTQIGAASAI